MDNGIFTIKNTNETNKVLKQELIVYTLNGEHDTLLNECPILLDKNKGEKNEVLAETLDKAYAKKQINGDKESYYIRISADGSLYNPMNPSLNTTKQFKLMGKDKKWQFTKVTKESFEHYLSMLKTRNVLQYKFAEKTR